MKRLLFISRSSLCHNLLQEVLSLISVRTEMVALEGLAQVERLPEGEKKFALVVIDQNCLDGDNAADRVDILTRQRAVIASRKILIYSHDRKPDSRLTAKISFETIAAKPFLPEELASLIEKNLS